MPPGKWHKTGAGGAEPDDTTPKAKTPGSRRGARSTPPSGGGPRHETRLADVPAKYRSLYRRAWDGKSRKAAIRAFCLECVCWSKTEVRLCTAPACPLFEYRERG